MHRNAQKCIKVHKSAYKFIKMHIPELLVFAFSEFFRKIQIVCGVWSPATPAFRMYGDMMDRIKLPC